MELTRRGFTKRTVGVTVIGAGPPSSGCLHGDGGETEDGKTVVEAGPSGNEFAFVPEEVTVGVGDTVRWVARSPRHNVVYDPEDTEEAELPGGAEPFKSYEEGENINRPIPQGESHEHTFETTGEYVYVCIPHLRQDMVGKVTVVSR